MIHRKKIIQILWQTNDKTDWENKLIGGCMHNLVKLDAISRRCPIADNSVTRGDNNLESRANSPSCNQAESETPL